MLHISSLLLAFSCTGKDPGAETPTPPESTPVCARPADAVRDAGDANGDGAVDVADAVLLLRHTTQGGPAPACLDAVDLLPDDKVQPDDAFSLLVHLGEDLFDTDAVQTDRCDEAVPLSPPSDCASLQARVQAPASSPAGAFQASVLLEGALPVEGWQLLLSAEGCTLSAADTAGTAAARIVDDPPGRRDLGYDRSRIHQGEARSLVVLGFMEPVALPVGEAQTVLTVQVEAPDCGPCTLRLREAVLAANGAAWPLPEVQAEVDICG